MNDFQSPVREELLQLVSDMQLKLSSNSDARIGSLLLKFRERASLSQAEFAQRIAVHVNTLRRWENDKNSPPLSKIRILPQLFGLEGVQPSPVNIQPDSEFFGKLAEWVDEWEKWRSKNLGQSNSCDFFFFGPEHLPVFGSEGETIQEFWSNNLIFKHVNYNVFWILEGCSLNDFSSAISTLRKIDTHARFLSKERPEAKLYVRGVAFKDRPDNQVLTLYKKACQTLKQDLDEKAVLKLEDPRYLESDENWIRVMRIGTEIPLMIGRINWSMSENMESILLPPLDFSACRLAKMSGRIDGMATKTGWAFYDKDKTSELVKYIASITT